MSLNMPINNDRPDWIPAVESGSRSGSVGKEGAGSEAHLPLNISKVAQLKEAELRGANYSISDEQLVKVIERAIKAMQGKSTSLEFSIHDKTKQISVKVRDNETGEVIREIPPEKTLEFVAKLWEMAGILVDERR